MKTAKILIGMLLISILCYAVLSFANTSKRTTHSQAFLDGVKKYNQGDYKGAVDLFLSIVQTDHIKNGKLYYNLANAYLKAGDLGHAMLWYERAKRLRPYDPDLNFNLQYASSLVKDKRDTQQNPIFEVLFFWKYLLGQRAIRYLAIVFNAIFWILLSIQHLRQKKGLKILTIITLTVSLIMVCTAGFDFYSDKYMQKAIILPKKVSIRSGFAKDATELFVLHAGSKVKIEKKSQGFYLIYFEEGKIGWLSSDDLGII